MDMQAPALSSTDIAVLANMDMPGDVICRGYNVTAHHRRAQVRRMESVLGASVTEIRLIERQIADRVTQLQDEAATLRTGDAGLLPWLDEMRRGRIAQAEAVLPQLRALLERRVAEHHAKRARFALLLQGVFA